MCLDALAGECFTVPSTVPGCAFQRHGTLPMTTQAARHQYGYKKPHEKRFGRPTADRVPIETKVPAMPIGNRLVRKR